MVRAVWIAIVLSVGCASPEPTASGEGDASAVTDALADASGLDARSVQDAPSSSDASRDAAAGASDIVGKISVGYQGWFTAPGDGSNINPPWWHVTPNRQTPTSINIAFRSWPDMTDIAKSYTTGF